MITANQILEIYKDSVKVGNQLVVIYENPTIGDYQTLRTEMKLTDKTNSNIRFLVDAKMSKVYVWDAFLSIHQDMAIKILGTNKYQLFPYVVCGFAKFINSSGIPKVFSLQLHTPQQINSFSNWKWVDKYLNKFSSYPN